MGNAGYNKGNTVTGQHPKAGSVLPAKPIAFDYEYSETCQPCREAGNPDVKLGFSVSHGGICCATGAHSFDSLPVDGQQAPEVPKTSTDAPEAAQAPAVRLVGGFAQKFTGMEPRFGPDAQEIKHRLQEAAQDKMRERARVGNAAPGEPELPAPVIDAGVEIVGKVRVSGLKPVPGGNAEFTLTLREPLLQAVRAEAEIQRQSPEVFLQEMLERNLDAWITS